MAFNLFKKPLPDENSKKNPKFKDKKKELENNDELSLDELEHVGGNYNEVEFSKLRQVGREIKEEQANMLKK